MLLTLILLSVLNNLASTIIINHNVERITDLKHQIVRISEIITFQNGYKSSINVYSYVLDDPFESYVEFYQNNTLLSNQFVIHKNETYIEYIVRLLEPVKSFEKATIKAIVARTNRIKLLNKKRKPYENRIYEYIGNVFVFSKYITKNFKCVLHVTDSILELSEKFHQGENRIVYRAIELKPYSRRKFHMIFENDKPFYEVTHLERTIYVSHYGRILVQENIELANAGSRLEGAYDSVGTKRNWFHTHLPASAENICLYDILGNNSKSETTTYKNSVMLRFQLRYPLLGGWKSEYNLDYAVPAYEYLKSDDRGEKFHLRMRTIDHVLTDVVIKDAAIRVVLPAGAEIERINYAQQFYNKSEQLSFTSLSFYGRPTVAFDGHALTESHILPFDVVYRISPFYYYRIPLILSAYIQILFILAILFRYFKY